MKRWVRISVIFVAVAALVISGTWLSWRLEMRRLHSVQSVVEETGLLLPDRVRITAARTHLFSVVDGANYEWLIQSDTSLVPWVRTNMRPETGGWEHIRYMAELGFPKEMPSDAKFGGVWKAYQRGNRGRQQTSYLHLAEDGRIGILSTFRP